MSRHAIAADYVFDGLIRHRDCVVLIDNSRIAGLAPRSGLSPSIDLYEAPPGAWLAPGFIDIQVNGGGDVLFNADRTPEGVAKIVEAHLKFGTTALLPTLITDTDGVMIAARNAVETMMAHDPGVLGLQLEGPFLSREKPGGHCRDVIRQPEPHHVRMLTKFVDGVLLVTLGPEQTPADFIVTLVAAGAKVALGHSMATYAQTLAAMAQGASSFTHLFSAMPPLSAREPGPVAAALESPDAFYGLIVDGEHVAPAMLKLAMQGADHPMLVSDAMRSVAGSSCEFALQGKRITVRDGRYSTPKAHSLGHRLEWRQRSETAFDCWRCHWNEGYSSPSPNSPTSWAGTFFRPPRSGIPTGDNCFRSEKYCGFSIHGLPGKDQRVCRNNWRANAAMRLSFWRGTNLRGGGCYFNAAARPARDIG